MMYFVFFYNVQYVLQLDSGFGGELKTCRPEKNCVNSESNFIDAQCVQSIDTRYKDLSSINMLVFMFWFCFCVMSVIFGK